MIELSVPPKKARVIVFSARECESALIEKGAYTSADREYCRTMTCAHSPRHRPRPQAPKLTCEEPTTVSVNAIHDISYNMIEPTK